MKDSLDEVERKLNGMRFSCHQVTSIFTIANTIADSESLTAALKALIASGDLIFTAHPLEDKIEQSPPMLCPRKLPLEDEIARSRNPHPARIPHELTCCVFAIARDKKNTKKTGDKYQNT